MSYDRSSMPGLSNRCSKKDEPFRAWSRFIFYSEKFDEQHLASFETRPSVLGDKLVISGDCWCEPKGEASCVLHTRHVVTCKVFGVGGMIEQTVLGQIKGSYKQLSACTREYMGTDTYKAFRLKLERPRGPSPPPVEQSAAPLPHRRRRLRLHRQRQLLLLLSTTVGSMLWRSVRTYARSIALSSMDLVVDQLRATSSCVSKRRDGNGAR